MTADDPRPTATATDASAPTAATTAAPAGETITAPETPTEAPARPRFEDLPPAAQRALTEAAERRRLADEARAAGTPAPREIRGRDGPEPVRYGDWEKKGIISDF